MSERNDADVLIVGAGPVGLTLAIDLAQRGVSVALMEMRAAGEPPVGRSNVVSARSMEAFRRLGIARAVREAGLPADYPHDVAIRTSATGLELGRVKIPCRAERYTAKGGPDTGAAASRQPDLPRAGVARRRRGDAAPAHPEWDARRRDRAT
jgi:2-polyprenyl-6-methoxyphenol hydroxylase-like FAD-dependent oxidoreductase